MRQVIFTVPGCPDHSTNPVVLDCLETCPACSALYMAYLGLKDRMNVLKVEVVDGTDR